MAETPDIVEGTIVEADGESVEPGQALPEFFKNARGQRRLEDITVAAIETFLDNLARTGVVMRSAEAAGLTYYTINRLRKFDDTFKVMYEEAMECYREQLVSEVHRRAVEGWDEEVYSQKTGNQIGTIRKYDSRLLELMVKRHIPEFREKFEGTMTVTGGVLIAPAAAQTLHDWAARHGGPQLTTYADEAPPAPPALPDNTGGGTLPDGGDNANTQT